MKCYENITNFIQHNFFQETISNKARLISIFHDSIHFLSCKIYCKKKEYDQFLQIGGLEKKRRNNHKIKSKKKIVLNRNLKKSADNI